MKRENDQLVAKNDLMEKQLMEANNQMAQISEKSLSVSNLLEGATSKEQEWKSRFLSLEASYIDLDRAYQAGKLFLILTLLYKLFSID